MVSIHLSAWAIVYEKRCFLARSHLRTMGSAIALKLVAAYWFIRFWTGDIFCWCLIGFKWYLLLIGLVFLVTIPT